VETRSKELAGAVSEELALALAPPRVEGDLGCGAKIWPRGPGGASGAVSGRPGA